MGTSDQVVTTRGALNPARHPGELEDGLSGYLFGRRRYDFYWNRISHLAPNAVLLRGPLHLKPLQAGGDSDLDILLTAECAAVETFLANQGFHRFYKPQAYLKRYQLLLKDASAPYTIEFYTREEWGVGFRLADPGHVPAEPNLARLMHATVDGKGTSLFPDYPQSSLLPGFKVSRIGSRFFDRLGRALWKNGNTRLLTAYLLLIGLIRPDFIMISRTLLRIIGHRLWQLSHKPGLEVGLIGPDGAGKSSLAKALLNLPVPVRVIYMGYNECQTKVMAFAMRRSLPTSIKKLAAGYDFFMRRVKGWILSRRGWVIIYDRHPAERLIARPTGPSQNLANFLKGLYARPLDLTFWLTGDYETIYDRKKEQSPSELERMDRQFAEILRGRRIPFEKVDATREDANAVFTIAAERILKTYRKRHSMDLLGGVTGAILKG